MNWSGIVLGASAFLLIGVFHPIVIKAEYHWGKGCWWVFAIGGVGFCVASLLVSDVVLAAVLGVAGFSAFWSILELFEQDKRVKKGWFPRNPKRSDAARCAASQGAGSREQVAGASIARREQVASSR